jgi:hypothetical protein
VPKNKTVKNQLVSVSLRASTPSIGQKVACSGQVFAHLLITDCFLRIIFMGNRATFCPVVISAFQTLVEPLLQ